MLLMFLVFVLLALLLERHLNSLGMFGDPREQELKDLGSWWDDYHTENRENVRAFGALNKKKTK
jgi:hypothetical protein